MKWLILFLKGLLTLAGAVTLFVGSRFAVGGYGILTEEGDTTAGVIFIIGGLALAFSGLFFLWQSLKLKRR